MSDSKPLVARFDAWRHIISKKYLPVEIDNLATEISIGEHVYPVVIDETTPANEMHVIDATGKKVIIRF